MLDYILVTSGEPSGIGPDICLDLINYPLDPSMRLVVIGDIHLLHLRAKMLNKSIELVSITTQILLESKLNPTLLSAKQLWVFDIHCPNINCAGAIDYANAQYVLNTLDMAIKLCNMGISKTIVTAPVNKAVINNQLPFSGHTEYLAQQWQCKDVVMMLTNKDMRVALLTTHLPLAKVPAFITKELLSNTLDIIIASFKKTYNIINPKIAVCGLNPHAGEDGCLGSEELEIINPVIKDYQARGYNVSGAYPSDTIFINYKEFDVILAMYHDQGLPVLKFLGLDTGINITLGLPITRVSVDHGTATSLAGTNQASSQSLLEAVKFAQSSISLFKQSSTTA